MSMVPYTAWVICVGCNCVIFMVHSAVTKILIHEKQTSWQLFRVMSCLFVVTVIHEADMVPSIL